MIMTLLCHFSLPTAKYTTVETITVELVYQKFDCPNVKLTMEMTLNTVDSMSKVLYGMKRQLYCIA